MRHFTTLVSGLGLVTLLTLSAAAQQPQAPGEGKTAAPPRMGMQGMMPGCQDHAKLKAEVADALARVRKAQASTDQVAIKAALGAADHALTEVQAHFGRCMAMMDTMKGDAPAPKADEHKH
ncbi:MAG: hypothetical protein ABL971_06555 [Vicinamibacterales bacterium]